MEQQPTPYEVYSSTTDSEHELSDKNQPDKSDVLIFYAYVNNALG